MSQSILNSTSTDALASLRTASRSAHFSTSFLRSQSTAARKAGKSNSAPPSAYIVIKGVPRTYLPSDVETVLKRLGALRRQAIESNQIVRLPDYLIAPSQLPSTETEFHLTFADDASAQHCKAVLDGNTTIFHPTSSPSEQFLAASGRRGFRRIRPQIVKRDLKTWLDSYWASARNEKEQPAAAQEGEPASEVEVSDEGQPDLSRPPPPPATNPLKSKVSSSDDFKLAPYETKLRGRQVALDGVPGFVTDEGLRNHFSDFKLPSDDKAIQILPRRPYSIDTRVITFPTEAEAHRFVRRYHLTDFYSFQAAKRNLMRAQVIM